MIHHQREDIKVVQNAKIGGIYTGVSQQTLQVCPTQVGAVLQVCPRREHRLVQCVAGVSQWTLQAYPRGRWDTPASCHGVDAGVSQAAGWEYRRCVLGKQHEQRRCVPGNVTGMSQGSSLGHTCVQPWTLQVCPRYLEGSAERIRRLRARKPHLTVPAQAARACNGVARPEVGEEFRDRLVFLNVHWARGCPYP